MSIYRHNVYVRVISLKTLRAFWLRYPDAAQPLRHWYRTALHATWNGLQDARKAYPHADGVKTNRGETLTVFNIGGNKYRLVVDMRYDLGRVYIRSVLTHEDYDRATRQGTL